MKIPRTTLAFAIALSTGLAHAHPGGHGGPPFGAGEIASPHSARTVAIEMTDKGCKPAEVAAVTGETIRFTATNPTKAAREFAVGAADELKAHAEMVRKYPGMQGGKGSRVSVTAGGSAELVWKAAKPGRFAIACTVPGQFDAPAAGGVVVAKP